MTVAEFFPMWQALTPAQRALLEGSARPFHAPKGAIVHNGGLQCTGLLLVTRGQLRAFILSPEGREITIYRLFEGDLCLLSASCIMRSIQFDITVEAGEASDCLLIPPEAYKQVMEASAPLANFTSEIMASRFSDVMWLLENILWKSFDRRLAAFLLEEAAIRDATLLPLTHEAIGNHTGNPREVVTRMLKYFQSEGMVRLSRGTVELTDTEKLRALDGR